jgi:hypothetical protein
VIRSVFAIHDKQASEFAFPLHMSISSFTHSVSSFSQVLDQLSNSVAHRESPCQNYTMSNHDSIISTLA